MSSIPSSPSKRRFETMNDKAPLSPALKKRKWTSSVIQTSNSADADAVTGPGNDLCALAFSSVDDDDLHASIVCIAPESKANTPTSKTHGLDASYAAMDAESHNVMMALQNSMKSGKGTTGAYDRHIKNYEAFMVSDQAARQSSNANWEVVPPFPITATTVSAFLEFETKRSEKNSDGLTISGTRLSVESIKQCVSALEKWRHEHEHLYKDNPDALRSLREDPRITVYEENARKSERDRVTDEQTSRAKGVTSDSYTHEELTRISLWCLKFQGSPHEIHLSIRDRAMVLLSTCLSFRGDNIRSLLFSNLCIQDVDLGPAITSLALICYSDQGKTNVNGRIESQAAFRHRLPELCVVGGIGFYLYSYFHISQHPRFDFTPDFTKGGESGLRSWYRKVLFSGSGGDESEMTNEDHYKRTITMYKQNDISIRKATRAGRLFAATTAREHGASVDDTKSLGGWSQGIRTFRLCYDSGLPVDVMLAAASFDAKKQDPFFIAREALDPPLELSVAIFPWLEEEQHLLKERCKKLGNIATDGALSRFLELLQRLRRVILQDAAVLFSKYPGCPIFSFPPFNTQEFATFASQSLRIIQEAEDNVQQHIRTRTETMVAVLRDILIENNLAQERVRDEFRNQVKTQLQSIATVLSQLQAQLAHDQPISSKVAPSTPTPVPPLTPTMAAASAKPIHTLLPTSITAASTSLAPAVLIQQLLSPASNPTTFISSNGNVYPSTTFPMSNDPWEHEKQLAYIAKLEGQFSTEQLSKHCFEWIRATTSASEDEYLPVYQYWRPMDKLASPSIQQIWNEWIYGIDGHLSVMQLTATWGARWRRNSSALKTEASRRKKIITLIETLSKRSNWNVECALKFLATTYPIPYLRSARAFIDRLQKKDGEFMKEIEEEADKYSLDDV